MSPPIRPAKPADMPAIEVLYTAAFATEDLRPLVRALLALEEGVLSLVAPAPAGLAGHIAFTRCTIRTQAGQVALLGPLAVLPARQRQGIGAGLITAGLAQLRAAGVRHVLVLGDPAYYGRFGFRQEHAIQPTLPVPEAWAEAWQGLQHYRQTLN
jgi:putative acetyltransferase